jgi:tetratricopeptide (TPR) repeat protein
MAGLAGIAGLAGLAGLEAGPARAAAKAVRDLGTIDFPNSGPEAAQDAFIHGVLLLHSFEFDDAREFFQQAEKIAPGFALAYWGEAMTFNHPLWQEQDRDAALAALARLAPTPEDRQAKAGSPREAMYLAAVDVLYGEGTKAERDQAYMDAMRRLHEAYPEDLEAKTFYALSILGSVPARDTRTYMRAAAILEEVFAANPRHPGAVHYLIHSYDDPIHAPLGLRAARVYAQIAPAASHAQHMISHIYTALGRWDEVIEANVKAVRVSEERLERLGKPASGRNKHSLLWLEYGLLQEGRFEEARRKLDVMTADVEAERNPGQDWHFTAMRAHFAVASPQDELPSPIELGAKQFNAEVLQGFGSGLHDVAAGDLESAAEDHAELVRTIDEARKGPVVELANVVAGDLSEDDLRVAGILARELDALLHYHRGETNDAVRLLREATEDECARPLEYGPPTVVQPAPELLGEVLLALDRPTDAAAAFETSLDRYTGRAPSLAGLAQALRATGDEKRAAEVTAKLRAYWRLDEAAALAAGQALLRSPADSAASGG